MDRLVKLVGSRNRRFPAGGILLDDGKTLCKTVVCSPDVLVKVSAVLKVTTSFLDRIPHVT